MARLAPTFPSCLPRRSGPSPAGALARPAQRGGPTCTSCGHQPVRTAAQRKARALASRSTRAGPREGRRQEPEHRTVRHLGHNAHLVLAEVARNHSTALCGGNPRGRLAGRGAPCNNASAAANAERSATTDARCLATIAAPSRISTEPSPSSSVQQQSSHTVAEPR